MITQEWADTVLAVLGVILGLNIGTLAAVLIRTRR